MIGCMHAYLAERKDPVEDATIASSYGLESTYNEPG